MAALVLGVASLVAALSFVLFALGLLGGVVAAVLGVIAIAFWVRVGTFVARNTSVFSSFYNCIAKAGNRSEVSTCIAHLTNSIR